MSRRKWYYAVWDKWFDTIAVNEYDMRLMIVLHKHKAVAFKNIFNRRVEDGTPYKNRFKVRRMAIDKLKEIME